MRVYGLMIAVVMALAACSPPQQSTRNPAESSARGRAITDAAAVVQALYGPYRVADGQTPLLEQAAPWSARMAADIAAMHARTAAGDAPPLDFDPIIDAQDYLLSDISTTADSVVEGSHAIVRARFTNIGEPQEVLYDLVWEGDRWKVDNIRTSEWDMREIVTRLDE